jgi:serine/threonine protein phosphatase 1
LGGGIVYATGDIHGRLDLLNMLVRKQAQDFRVSQLVTGPHLIFLGDYVDRGPDSMGVLSRLIALEANPHVKVTCLLGNHEDMLLRFLDDPLFGPSWWKVGGGDTLGSYGLRRPSGRTRDDWSQLRDDFAAALPSDHLAFLRRLRLSATQGDYIFVHAGLRPGVAIADQARHDLLWIRGDFINDKQPFEKVVVHGHTPETNVHVDYRRIGLDTGAYASGVLSSVRLSDLDQTILQASSAQTTQPARSGIDANLSRPPG